MFYIGGLGFVCPIIEPVTFARCAFFFFFFFKGHNHKRNSQMVRKSCYRIHEHNSDNNDNIIVTIMITK